MKWLIHRRILHGVYEKKEDIPEEVNELATRYEGAIPTRTGWNIPMAFARQHIQKDSLFRPYLEEADYIIVYPKNDIQTKKHELLHAVYAMNPSYRSQVTTLWESLTKKEQERIHAVLLHLHYPNDPAILLDEFQAYYYTEKSSFFGIRPLRK
jgi:hypothetical protein